MKWGQGKFDVNHVIYVIYAIPSPGASKRIAADITFVEAKSIDWEA
jgi:hypothetical protein